MIYFFYGNDAVKAKLKIKKLTKVLLSKKSEALHFYFDDRTFDNEFVKSLFQSRGLFAEHHIVFLDRTFNLFESKDLVKDMQKSSHIFILFEDILQKKEIEYIKKYSEKSEEHEIKGVDNKNSRRNIFSLTDALMSRDKKRAWMLYRNLIEEGISPEEIQPMLFWQVKTMLVSVNSKSSTEAGLKSFVYSKSKKGAENYGKEELRKISRDIVQALYNSRRGSNLENELERVLLSL